VVKSKALKLVIFCGTVYCGREIFRPKCYEVIDGNLPLLLSGRGRLSVRTAAVLQCSCAAACISAGLGSARCADHTKLSSSSPSCAWQRPAPRCLYSPFFFMKIFIEQSRP
jgi:hypothetical protein